ncbi:MAG: MFS transporter [Clostridia bacterium]|nr:MFS transporter [Clostridia bacterium]
MKENESIKKYALICATTAAFLTPFMGSSINLAIPSIGDDFHASAYLLSWVVTSYLLASAVFLVPAGRLADLIGRKKIFVTGIAVFSVFSLFCGLAGTIEIFIFYRILQGIGSSMIFGTSMAILTSVFSPQERGRVLGINVAAVYTGLSVGPVLGGFLNHRLGWQSIFYLNFALGVFVFFLILFRLKGEWMGAEGESFDVLGSFLYTLGLLGFMYGLSSITSTDSGKFLLLAGIIILTIFVFYEIRIEYPLVNFNLFFRNITFTFSNIAALINYSASFAMTFLLSLYLQLVKGLDSQTAGLILLAQPLVMALLSPFAGTLSDRVEPRKVASLGMGITALALFVFYFIRVNTPLLLIVGNLALMGGGLALFSSPNTNAVMGSVEKRVYGVASSILGTMRLVGNTISMAVVTLMISIYVGDMEIQMASSSSIVEMISISFAVFTVVCITGVFASMARGSLHTVKEKR